MAEPLICNPPGYLAQLSSARHQTWVLGTYSSA